MNHNAQEWTPFATRLSPLFGLPVNRPMSVALSPSHPWFGGQSDFDSSVNGSTNGGSIHGTPSSTTGGRKSSHNHQQQHHHNTHSHHGHGHAIDSSPCFSSPSPYPSYLPSNGAYSPSDQLFLGESAGAPEHALRGLSLYDTSESPNYGNSSSLTSSILFSAMPVSLSRASIIFHGKIGHSENQLIYRLQLFFNVHRASTTAEAQSIFSRTKVDAVITKYGDQATVQGLEFIKTIRQSPDGARLFVVYFSRYATSSAKAQTDCMTAGCNMVSDDVSEVVNSCVKALKVIGRDPFTVGDTFECPLCHFNGLMQDELCEHVELFHGGQPNCKDVSCPICGVTCKNVRLPFPVHIHKAHGPVGRAKQQQPRKQHHTYIFALVVCQRKSDGKFLVVNEPASWGWWIPGGRVEWGEGLRSAAIRETKEEAGIDISVEGILKIEYSSGPSRTRQRIIFFARPLDDNARPKAVPDYESRGACWVSLEEVDQLPLRGEEPRKWFQYIAAGGEVYPMSLLSHNRDEEGI